MLKTGIWCLNLPIGLITDLKFSEVVAFTTINQSHAQYFHFPSSFASLFNI